MTDYSEFLRTGVLRLGPAGDQSPYRRLLRAALADRQYGPGLFIDEAEFRKNPRYKGVNPEPGRNLLEKLADASGFIQSEPRVVEALEEVLGRGYRVKDRKFVCGIPQEWMPDWVSQTIAENGVKNLGAYMRPEYRDITYFSGIDFHQDIIDWPSMGPFFITMYVYLDDVGAHDAPLHVLPGSHLFGATVFPHRMTQESPTSWRYEDGRGRSATLTHEVLTGTAGDVRLWHPFILHGTQPDRNSNPRISVRYLIQVDDPGVADDCLLRRVNAGIEGPLSLAETRRDLDDDGAAIIKGNTINSIQT